MRISLKLKSLKTGLVFDKQFDTEFARDNFLRKLRYSTNLQLMSRVDRSQYN
jgi:hypothetical protein